MQRPVSAWTTHRLVISLLCLPCFIFASSSTAANAFTQQQNNRPQPQQYSSADLSLTNKKSKKGVTTASPLLVRPFRSTSSVSMPTTRAMASKGGGDAVAPPVAAQRIRISAFDSMRFFLIAFICIGHFIRFVDPNTFCLNFFGQVNVVVGAFFVLSGYVTAYTATSNGAYEASPKLKPAPSWILSRVFGYFPLHVIVLALFSPVFLYADVSYNGWTQSLLHGLMSITMTQAWFPLHAEVWNAPSWFLSALTFATATMPFALPSLAKMTQPQLRKTILYLTGASLLPKLGYSYDHNAWGVMEGVISPKAFDNLAIFNNQRFNPFCATVEVLLGAAACRLVMLDGVDDKEKVPQPNIFSTLGPLLGMVAVLVLRAMDILKVNDMLTRTVIFLPLFVQFMMAAHRVAVAEATGTSKSKDPIVSFLSSKVLTSLGNLAFPIFLVHGPVGQIFYKKIIATKLFGGTMNKLYGPNFFYVFLATVVASAALLKALVLDNKSIADFSKKTAAKWSEGL